MSDPVAEAAEAARRGELVVLPTDTVYGIGTRPDDPVATARLFEAKARPHDLELPVLVAATDEARRIVVFDERAERLAVSFWPGGLTLVLPRTELSAPWDLGGDPTTIGVRVPSHPLARELLARAGPLAVTSANRSGQPPVGDCDRLHDVFGSLVAIYLCDDPLPAVPPSTVVDLAHGGVSVLREGLVATIDVERALKGD